MLSNPEPFFWETKFSGWFLCEALADLFLSAVFIIDFFWHIELNLSVITTFSRSFLNMYSHKDNNT